MRSLVREAIDEGARGFTTGLSYAPGLFASVEELAALAGVAAERGLTYHTHMRYGDLDVRGSVAEALDTAERAGVILNISHMYPRANQPLEEADILLGMLDDARARGLEVTFDLTMFPRGGGAWVQSLPGWARDGGNAATVAVIRDPASRARLIEELSSPSRLLVGGLGRPGHLQGQPAGERAPQRPDDRRARPRTRPGADRHRARPRPRGRPVLDRPDDQGPGSPRPPGREPAVRADRRWLRQPSRDAPGLRPHAQELRDVPAGARVVRPRPRRPDARGGGSTRSPPNPPDASGSRIGGCSPRGWPRTSWCSIPATIGNRATEADPAARPAGIDRVMVNGAWAVSGGRATGERAGLSL